jgi:hypothetical protein
MVNNLGDQHKTYAELFTQNLGQKARRSRVFRLLRDNKVGKLHRQRVFLDADANERA